MPDCNFNINGQDLKWSDPIRPGRFSFEVVNDDFQDSDSDDGLFSGKMLQNIASFGILFFLVFLGSKYSDRFENISFNSFETKIASPRPKNEEAHAIKDEPLIELGEPLISTVEPVLAPQGRLFNPDGTMKAPFPLPPGTPPEEYQAPEKQAPPAVIEKKPPAMVKKFNPDNEAYDPYADSGRSNRTSSNSYRAQKSKSIGGYEIFDPEKETYGSDWEFFDDPRR